MSKSIEVRSIYSEAQRNLIYNETLFMSDSVLEILSWVNSGLLRSKCRRTSLLQEMNMRVCKGRGRDGRGEEASDSDAIPDICQRAGRKQSGWRSFRCRHSLRQAQQPRES